ncbi:hypothetical protein [Nonomuraea sp. NPDC003214]
MIRFRPRPREEQKPPRERGRVCLDGQQPATEVARADGWVVVQLDDGATPTVLADRITPCTCAGKGCK